MNIVQDFCLKNIMSSSTLDKNYTFTLNPVINLDTPAIFNFTIYGISRTTPLATELYPSSSYTLQQMNLHAINNRIKYSIFSIGRVDPEFLNFFKYNNWYKDRWIRASEDMTVRDYIIRVYDDNGIIYPRSHTYYTVLDEGTILVALKSDMYTDGIANFNTRNFKYINVYKPNYFNSAEYLSIPIANRIGIFCISNHGLFNTEGIDSNLVTDLVNEYDKVNIGNTVQGNISYLYNKLATYGIPLVIMNGMPLPLANSAQINYYQYTLSNNNNFIEIFFDNSIFRREVVNINNLREFTSTLDNKTKVVLTYSTNTLSPGDILPNKIYHSKDNDIYISKSTNITSSNISTVINYGLYLYNHTEYSIRNITDKDYSIYSQHLNNLVVNLRNKTNSSNTDPISVVLYRRKSDRLNTLSYSSLKLQELYKLPYNKYLDVLTNMNYTITDFRADTLERSDYFKVMNAQSASEITEQLAVNCLGYNGITYYFANTPNSITGSIVNVPQLYSTNQSYAFEYDNNGTLLNTNTPYITTGVTYTKTNLNATTVEFLYGTTPANYGRLYNNNETITPLYNDYKLISAYFNGVNRSTAWIDITNDPLKRTINADNTITLNETSGVKVKIVYFNQPLVYNVDISLVNGIMYFPITIQEDRGTGLQYFNADVPYSNIEVFLNGYKLAYNVDFYINFPYINIVNTKFINQNTLLQNVQIRAYGFTLNVNEINATELTGLVDNGVVLRNGSYQISDDKVFSAYIDGKLVDRSTLIFAENDVTIRSNSIINNLPYSIKEPFIPTKSITGLSSYELFVQNKEKNKRIEDLFNIVFPEPIIQQQNIPLVKYKIYSPLINKIIDDIEDGNINSSLYMNPYDDNTILTLLSDPIYSGLLTLDPVKRNLNLGRYEILPHCKLVNININLFKYRFIEKIINVITNNNPNIITLTGYLTAVA